MGQGRLKGAIDPYYASPVAADGKIFMPSETGKIAVLAPGGTLEPIVVNDLQDDIYATPRSPTARSICARAAGSTVSGSLRDDTAGVTTQSVLDSVLCPEGLC